MNKRLFILLTLTFALELVTMNESVTIEFELSDPTIQQIVESANKRREFANRLMRTKGSPFELMHRIISQLKQRSTHRYLRNMADKPIRKMERLALKSEEDMKDAFKSYESAFSKVLSNAKVLDVLFITLWNNPSVTSASLSNKEISQTITELKDAFETQKTLLEKNNYEAKRAKFDVVPPLQHDMKSLYVNAIKYQYNPSSALINDDKFASAHLAVQTLQAAVDSISSTINEIFVGTKETPTSMVEIKKEFDDFAVSFEQLTERRKQLTALPHYTGANSADSKTSIAEKLVDLKLWKSFANGRSELKSAHDRIEKKLEEYRDYTDTMTEEEKQSLSLHPNIKIDIMSRLLTTLSEFNRRLNNNMNKQKNKWLGFRGDADGHLYYGIDPHYKAKSLCDEKAKINNFVITVKNSLNPEPEKFVVDGNECIFRTSLNISYLKNKKMGDIIMDDENYSRSGLQYHHNYPFVETHIAFRKKKKQVTFELRKALPSKFLEQHTNGKKFKAEDCVVEMLGGGNVRVELTIAEVKKEVGIMLI